MTDPTTPTTEAGRALYNSLRAKQSHNAEPISTLPSKGWPFRDAILAIEAQARADERRRLAGLVEALPGIVLSSSSGTDGHLSWGIYRAAVLALLSDTEPAP